MIRFTRMNRNKRFRVLVNMSLPESVLGLTDDQIDRVVAMAWEDRTPFEAIFAQFGLRENEVRALMRAGLEAVGDNLSEMRSGAHAEHHG